MPLLKRTLSTFGVKAATPDHAEETRPLTFEDARDLVHHHLASSGLSSARGLNEDGTGGAHIGSTQLYYDFDHVHRNLRCSALVYHFRHHPTPDVIQAFRDSVAEIDTGGGQLLYEDDNSGLYLTREYFEVPSRSQFKKDMEHLLRAARDWSDMGAEHALTHLQGANVPHMAPVSDLPKAAPPKPSAATPVPGTPTTVPSQSVGKQSAARRAHQRSDSMTPPLSSTQEGDRANQQDVGDIRRFASTPVSAHPTKVTSSAVAATPPAPSPGEQPGLIHPRPVPARAVHTSTPRPPTNGVPRIGIVAAADHGEFAADAQQSLPGPPKLSPGPRKLSPEAPKKSPPHEPGASHESLFQKLRHKLPHRPHSPKVEEEKHHSSHPHALAKLDPNEPRPSGMPLRIYSSSSPSRAMWEHTPSEHKAHPPSGS